MLLRALRHLRDRVDATRDPVAFARRIGVTVGPDCRLLGIDRGTFGSEPYLVRLGEHVTITAGVQFITHDGGVWVFRRMYPDLDVIGRVVVGDNVFVGTNAIILPGVSVGNDVVIGAGSVVARDVPSGTVVAGVPARTIRTLQEYEARVMAAGVHLRGLAGDAKKQAFLRHTAERGSAAFEARTESADAGES